MDKIIVILGSTATGKSTLAFKLAQDINAEIVNTDAYQVYREINKGVNKITKEKREIVKHHFIDSISIYDEFDIKIFQERAREAICEIIKKKKNIIVTGGSGLYLDSLIKNYNLSAVPERKKVTFFDDKNYDFIYNYLLEKDKEEALKIGYNNQRRIIRAAQSFYETKKTKKELNQNVDFIYDVFFINIVADREKLIKKIDNRVDEMIKNNWKDEVIDLYKKDHNVINLQAFKAIGYSDILLSYLNNQEINVENIKKLTRQYAKRQVTWNKRYDSLDIKMNEFDYNALLYKVKEFLR